MEYLKENQILIEAKEDLESQIGLLNAQIASRRGPYSSSLNLKPFTETRALIESLNQTVATSEQSRLKISKSQIQSLNQHGFLTLEFGSWIPKEDEISDLQGDLT